MRKNIKLASLISYITLFLGNIISLVYTPFMLSTLQEKEYGLFSLVNTIISYIYLLDMGMGNAIIRYNSKYIANNDKQSLEKLNGMFLVLYSFISLVGLIIGSFLYKNLEFIFAKGLSFNEIKQVKIMFLIALVNLVFSFPFNVFSGIIMANEEFIFAKTINLVRTVLNPIIMVFVLLNGYKALGMLIASTVFNIVLGFINVVYCFIILKIKIKFKGFDKTLYKEIFKYSFFVFLAAIASKIYWSTDQTILGMYVGSASIAVYSIGLQFNGYFTSFSNVISSMFLPKLTKIVCGDNNRNLVMDLLIKVSRIQLYIASLVLMGFILVGKEFIMLWAGEEYKVSYYIALLVMIPQVFSIIQTLFATMLEAMNKHKVKSLIYLSVAILNLIITLILVKSLGAIGCALGTAIGMLINALMNNLYYIYNIKLNMSYYWSEIGKIALQMTGVFAIGVAIKRIINPNSYLDILMFILIFVVLDFVICWRFVFNKYEKVIAKSAINRIVRTRRFKVKNVLDH